jgi:serine/threonine protein kinase
MRRARRRSSPRPRDRQLNRDVAIKILPPLFTKDTDRLLRFEREAKILAALNHPHIGAIYGLERVDGMPALVLELVDGPTLADRLLQGPFTVKDTTTPDQPPAQWLRRQPHRGPGGDGYRGVHDTRAGTRSTG